MQNPNCRPSPANMEFKVRTLPLLLLIPLAFTTLALALSVFTTPGRLSNPVHLPIATGNKTRKYCDHHTHTHLLTKEKPYARSSFLFCTTIKTTVFCSNDDPHKRFLSNNCRHKHKGASGSVGSESLGVCHGTSLNWS